MGNYYDEADPVNLCRAIVLVYDRWIMAEKEPGSDQLITSTRRHRPQLVGEIEAEWCRIVGYDIDEDKFPYHESYIIRKWTQFRKLSDGVKQAWIREAKELE